MHNGYMPFWPLLICLTVGLLTIFIMQLHLNRLKRPNYTLGSGACQVQMTQPPIVMIKCRRK